MLVASCKRLVGTFTGHNFLLSKPSAQAAGTYVLGSVSSTQQFARQFSSEDDVEAEVSVVINVCTRDICISSW